MKRRKVRLRAPGPGDLGWVVQAHGALYAREFRYNRDFEGLVAGIVADFVRNYDATRERCWSTEVDSENAGAVFCVRQAPTVAKLRLLILDPGARGLGLGTRLVSTCIRFARAAGYRKLVLWTQSHLAAARAIYVNAGFRLVKTEPHRSFGRKLTGEYWELKLNARVRSS